MPAQPGEDDGVRFALKHCVDVLESDTAARQFGAICHFRQIRFGAEQLRRLDNCLFEAKVLERVQSVVVDKHTYGTLHRKQVRHVFNSLPQLIAAQLFSLVALPQAKTT
jgi:hypothetical protein